MCRLNTNCVIMMFMNVIKNMKMKKPSGMWCACAVRLQEPERKGQMSVEPNGGECALAF